jgi:acetamidase/formamidase
MIEHRKRRKKYGWLIVLMITGSVVMLRLGDRGATSLEGVVVAAGRDDTHEDRGKWRDEYAIRHPDYFLPSRPETMVWGGFPINYPPALTIQSGQTVRIDTIAPDGSTNATLDPVAFFGLFGVKPEEVLQDARDFWATRESKIRYGGHPLTGPIYIDGAEPGDTLEIQILDVSPRVPYGINSTSAFRGVLSMTYPGFRTGDPGLDIPSAPPDAPGGLLPDQLQHLYRIARIKGQDVAVLADGVHVPIAPFMGVMAVASPEGVFVVSTPNGPPPATGVQSSGPPGPFGGNFDHKDLKAGTSLYLPVFQYGAQFFTGDGHSVQGDGELSGGALEHSLTGVFRFILHKGKTIQWPRAENDTHYIIMGIDHDFQRAMRIATLEVVKFLVEEKGFENDAKAFSFASLAVDMRASEVVDGTQVASAYIPKSAFVKKANGRRPGSD